MRKMQENTKIDRVFAAREFAVAAHGDQKYGDEPYVSHLDDVATLCLHHLQMIGVMESVGDKTMQFRPLIVDCLVAAYLHDVLEDTEKTEGDISLAFGPEAAHVAASLSDPPGKNRKERKMMLHARLESVDERTSYGSVVLAVKAMDRLANLRKCRDGGNTSLLEMYQKEALAFRKAVFRSGMCGQAWVEIDRICS